MIVVASLGAVSQPCRTPLQLEVLRLFRCSTRTHPARESRAGMWRNIEKNMARHDMSHGEAQFCPRNPQVHENRTREKGNTRRPQTTCTAATSLADHTHPNRWSHKCGPLLRFLSFLRSSCWFPLMIHGNMSASPHLMRHCLIKVCMCVRVCISGAPA